MRLICPNCGAQYEVDERVIPDGGRDVQCSNCGLAWFQRSARAEEEAKAAEEQATLPDEISPHDDDDYEPAPEAETAPDPAPEAPAARDEDDYEDDDADEGPGPELPKRPLDDSVRSILEEEAALEMQAREHEAQQIETQPDLGIDSPVDPEAERRRIARERMARMRGIEDGESLEHEVQDDAPDAAQPAQTTQELQDVAPDADTEAAVAATMAASRTERAAASRDVFPDIEEINSTLDSPAQSDPGNLSAEQVAEAAEARSGFKRGFSVVIILAALALAIYMFAPQIAAKVPALKPALAAYVEAINGLRASIEGMMQNTIDKMEDAAQPVTTE